MIDIGKIIPITEEEKMKMISFYDEGMKLSQISKILQIYRIDNLNKFFNYIYNERNYFLGRKYDKFIKALEHYKKDYNVSSISKLSFLI